VVPASSHATAGVNGTPVQLANSAVEQTTPRQVSAGRTWSGVGAAPLPDGLGVVVADAVVVFVPAGVDVASGVDPPPQPDRQPLARTAAHMQATR
jgi:hypothetical protein